MGDFSIRDILTQISKGNLRIPSFQRGFVWEADYVAFLMDSIYKKYPFGTIQLWRTREQLTSEKEFGPFQLFVRDQEYPIDYVLDGQQRITSIFGVFQNDIAVTEGMDNPFNIYFDLSASDTSQDSQFLAFGINDCIELTRYFPLHSLFDTVQYRKATQDLSEDNVKKIDQLQEIFKEVKIPYQTLETDDKTKVAIAFERINRKGIPLNTLQLLTAWTWNDDFYLQYQFEELCKELEPFGFYDLSGDTELLLRITSAIITNNAASDSLISLTGINIRQRFNEVRNGVTGSIDFLRKNLLVEKISNLPYETLLIPLSVFFAQDGNQQFKLEDNQRKSLISWFWRVSFSKRYSSGTTSNINKDITSLLALKTDPDSQDIFDIPISISEMFFQINKFNMGSVNTKSFVLLLAQLLPKSLISGVNITLSDVLNGYNRNEFHHIYPKSYLLQIDNLEYDINCLSNFCILSKVDNNRISNKAPSLYRDEHIKKDAQDILKSHLITESLLVADNFNDFIKDRSKLLLNYLNFLIQKV